MQDNDHSMYATPVNPMLSYYNSWMLWNKQGMQLFKNGTLFVSRRYSYLRRIAEGSGVTRLPCRRSRSCASMAAAAGPASLQPSAPSSPCSAPLQRRCRLAPPTFFRFVQHTEASYFLRILFLHGSLVHHMCSLFLQSCIISCLLLLQANHTACRRFYRGTYT